MCFNIEYSCHTITNIIHKDALYCTFLLALLYVEWLVSDLQLNMDLRGPHFQVQCKNILLRDPT